MSLTTSLQQHHQNDEDENKMDLCYPFDETTRPFFAGSTVGVPGFPEFSWTMDGETTTTTTTTSFNHYHNIPTSHNFSSNWEARRRGDSILAASTSFSKSQVKLHKNQQQRKRLLQRQSVNVAVTRRNNTNCRISSRTCYFRRRQCHFRERDHASKFTMNTTEQRHPSYGGVDHNHNDDVIFITNLFGAWNLPKRELIAHQSTAPYQRKQSLVRTKRYVGVVKGGNRNFYGGGPQPPLETILEHRRNSSSSSIGISNVTSSVLGLENKSEQKREQRAMLDLHVEMKYLKL
jgi:hypothetical protein